MRFVYTTEHLEFLRTFYPQLSLPNLTRAFNECFDQAKTESQLKAATKNHKIRCGRTTGQMNKGRSRLFSRAEADFIKVGYTLMSLTDLTVALNAKFGTGKTEMQIRSFTRNHSIKSGRTGYFDAGSQPWNAGTKGVMKPNSGTFKKGDVPGNTRPIGSERICSKDGYIQIKIRETNPYTGARTRFKAKHVVIWEQAHGLVPDGMCVSFIDGDKLNCTVNNLELISRQELQYRNKNGYQYLPEEVKPTFRLLAKVQSKRFSLLRRVRNR